MTVACQGDEDGHARVFVYGEVNQLGVVVRAHMRLLADGKLHVENLSARRPGSVLDYAPYDLGISIMLMLTERELPAWCAANPEMLALAGRAQLRKEYDRTLSELEATRTRTAELVERRDAIVERARGTAVVSASGFPEWYEHLEAQRALPLRQRSRGWWIFEVLGSIITLGVIGVVVYFVLNPV